MSKALLLDFGSVISYSLFEQHRVSEKRLGLPEGTLTWLGPFDPSSDGLWQRMQRDEITQRDYWAYRAKETGELMGEDWTMLELLTAVRDADKLVRPELEELVHDAVNAGLAVGILSNELELFYGRETMDKLEILKSMDFIVDATHTRILKPDAKAYYLALKELTLSAENVVFVDDQMRNVKGAEAVGMQAVYFDITDVEGSIRQIRRALEL